MSTEIKPGMTPSKTDAVHLYDFGLSQQFSERVMTAAAVALAISVVSAVGLLMGMS